MSLPSYQRAVVHLEWDVLLIQCLTRPEMALMGAVMSPIAFLADSGQPQRGLKCPLGITRASDGFCALAELYL